MPQSKQTTCMFDKKVYGEHLTPVDIFHNFIFPFVKNEIFNYRWVDLFCGTGNLILPILNFIPTNKREDFFKKHIFLFDIQKSLVEQCIENAYCYGIPESVAEKNILCRDTILDYPDFILDEHLPVYHITNPPYFYKVSFSRHKKSENYIDYFSYFEPGYQDLYQLALANDIRHYVENMVYIIPSNFLFGHSCSNKIRRELFRHYKMNHAFLFERKIFQFTGQHVVICFFERNQESKRDTVSFDLWKIGENNARKRTCVLHKSNNFRAGYEFEDFLKKFKSRRPLEFDFCLKNEEVKNNIGNNRLMLIDVNQFDGKRYKKRELFVNDYLFKRVKSNLLFVRTLDSVNHQHSAGLYLVRDIFDADGIFVSKTSYRSHPTQILFISDISPEHQILLKDYFNLILGYFREQLDSEFMTTYKYSNNNCVRKYLGLSQVRKLIYTFPILDINENQIRVLSELVKNKNVKELMEFLASI